MREKGKVFKWLTAFGCMLLTLALFSVPVMADRVISSNVSDNQVLYFKDNVDEGQTVQMGGDTYTNALVYTMGYHGGYDAVADFNLRGKYKSVTFYAGLVKKHENRDADFKVYLDGTCVRNQVLKLNDLPVRVELNLENVHQMQIRMRCGGYAANYFAVGGMNLVSNGEVQDVKIKQETLELSKENPSAVLSATVIPVDARNQKVIWTSSNPSVATVDANGVVRGVSGGEADIIATTQEGGFQSVCKVKADMPKSIQNAAVTLSSSSYLYDQTEKKPEVTVSLDGRQLSQNWDYTVSYSNNLNAGTAVAVINGIGDYAGTVQKTFTIQKAEQSITLPKKSYTVTDGQKAFSLKANSSVGTKLTYRADNSMVKVSESGRVTIQKPGRAVITVTAPESANYKAKSATVKIAVRPRKTVIYKAVSKKTKTAKITWKRDKDVTGYEVQYSKSKRFSGKKTVKITKNRTTSATLKKLSSQKTYYVRVRAYEKTSKGTLYGAFSKTLKVKVK